MLDFPHITIEDIRPGQFRIDHDDYHRGEGLSSSVLKNVIRSPAHSRVEMADSPALAFGRAFHMAALEPKIFECSYAVAPKCDRRTKEGKAIYAGWALQNGEKEVISSDDWLTISSMVSSLAFTDYWSRIKDYDVEIATFVLDEPTGILKKCKADMMGDVIVDLKSTQDARPDSFVRSVINFGYHISAAYYQDIIYEQTGRRLPFVWVAIEKKEPFGVMYYECPPIMIERGREEYREALKTYAKCIETDEFPCYPQGLQDLPIPGWFK